MHRVFVAAIATGALAATTGCGAANDLDPDVVAQAAGRTAATGGAKVAFSVAVAAQRIGGGGFVDLRGRAARLSVGLPGGAGSLDEVLLHQTVYVHLPPALAKQVPGRRPWGKIDLARVLRARGLGLGALAGSPGNPADQLAQLRGAGNVRKVGTAAVRGVPTTHYRAELDLRKAIDRAPPAERAAARATIERLITMTGSRTVPVDAWIDGAGRLRRMTTSEHVSGQAVTVTLELYDFGTREAVQAPPDSQTSDLTSLVAKSVP